MVIKIIIKNQNQSQFDFLKIKLYIIKTRKTSAFLI